MEDNCTSQQNVRRFKCFFLFLTLVYIIKSGLFVLKLLFGRYSTCRWAEGYGVNMEQNGSTFIKRVEIYMDTRAKMLYIKHYVYVSFLGTKASGKTFYNETNKICNV